MDLPRLPDVNRYERAEWYQERIERQIKEMLDELEAGQTLRVEVILNDGRRIRPTWFGYHNPNMLVIDGEDGDGRPVRLLAAHTDVQILLTVMEATTPSSDRKIGFQSRGEQQ